MDSTLHQTFTMGIDPGVGLLGVGDRPGRPKALANSGGPGPGLVINRAVIVGFSPQAGLTTKDQTRVKSAAIWDGLVEVEGPPALVRITPAVVASSEPAAKPAVQVPGLVV